MGCTIMAKLTVHRIPEGAGDVLVDNRHTFEPPRYPDTITLTLRDRKVEAVAAEGYIFDHWAGEVEGTDAVEIVKLDGDRIVLAVFRPVGEPVIELPPITTIPLDTETVPLDSGTIEEQVKVEAIELTFHCPHCGGVVRIRGEVNG
jgi:hypothetical protein